jgi:hypothetical protein
VLFWRQNRPDPLGGSRRNSPAVAGPDGRLQSPYRAVASPCKVTLSPLRNGPRPYRGNVVTPDDPAPEAVDARSAALRKWATADRAAFRLFLRRHRPRLWAHLGYVRAHLPALPARGPGYRSSEHLPEARAPPLLGMFLALSAGDPSRAPTVPL